MSAFDPKQNFVAPPRRTEGIGPDFSRIKFTRADREPARDECRGEARRPYRGEQGLSSGKGGQGTTSRSLFHCEESRGFTHAVRHPWLRVRVLASRSRRLVGQKRWIGSGERGNAHSEIGIRTSPRDLRFATCDRRMSALERWGLRHLGDGLSQFLTPSGRQAHLAVREGFELVRHWWRRHPTGGA